MINKYKYNKYSYLFKFMTVKSGALWKPTNIKH